jgi:ubiquinone/menaquinone biosynthesis C-methylase UbiE
MKRVDYDRVAQDYDARYVAGGPPGIESALRDLARKSQAGRILEVGCGTGQWLGVFPKNATSQLTLLSDEEFDAGMGRIENSLLTAGADNESISFVVDIYLPIVVGRVPES